MGDEWTTVGGTIKDWTWQYARTTAGPIIIHGQTGFDQPPRFSVYGCEGRTAGEAVAKFVEVREIAARYVD